MRRIAVIITAAVFCLLLWLPAYAVTIVDVTKGDPQFVKVSRKDLNRIIVPYENPKVFTAKEGIDVKIEGKNLFVRVSDAAPTAELFVTGGERTCSLILVPSEIPAQTVVLKEAAFDRKEAESWERDHGYVTAVKNLIKAMAAGTVPDGYDLADSCPEDKTFIYKTVALKPTRRYRGFHLLGLEYRLENLGKDKAELLENEFYEPGVLAVSMEKLTLEPKEKTVAYIVKDEGLR